jgi:hypothetical protein
MAHPLDTLYFRPSQLEAGDGPRPGAAPPPAADRAGAPPVLLEQGSWAAHPSDGSVPIRMPLQAKQRTSVHLYAPDPHHRDTIATRRFLELSYADLEFCKRNHPLSGPRFFPDTHRPIQSRNRGRRRIRRAGDLQCSGPREGQIDLAGGQESFGDPSVTQVVALPARVSSPDDLPTGPTVKPSHVP